MPDPLTYIDPLDLPVYGAANIAVVLNLLRPDGTPDERRAFYGLEKGYYVAEKKGRRWQSTPRRLLGLPRNATGAA